MELRVPFRDRLLIAVSHVLHVRRSELDRCLRMAGLAVVLGTGLYTAFNATQAIFLTAAGPQAYPAFFIVLALSVWPALSLNALATRRLGGQRALNLALAVNVVLPLPIFAAYLLALSGPVAFVCYVLYSVAFEVAMLQFWGFVSQYFNILEAKRIYPVIAAGSGLGYIFAGGVTSVLATMAGTPALCLVWSAGALAALAIAIRAEHRLFRPPVSEDADRLHADHVELRRRRGSWAALREAAGYLRQRLVLALFLGGVLLMIAMRVSDYVAAQVFVERTHNLTDLTILIGGAWEISYVLQLLLGLWLTPWVLSKAGVKNAILALPAFSIVGFLLVFSFPGLASALFLFIVRNGIQTGLDDPAGNVLQGALPEQIQPRLKLLLDNLVFPGSAMLAGLALLSVQAVAGHQSLRLAAGVGLVAAVAFTAAALWVRSLYVTAIYQRLRSHTLSLSDLQLALGRPSGAELEELIASIRSDSPRVREFAAAALARVAPDRFRAMAGELASSEDPRVRRLAFQMAPLGTFTIPVIAAAAADEDPWVAAAAAVAGNALKPPWPGAQAVLDQLYRHEEPEFRAASVWASAFVGDHHEVAVALGDARPRVRLEAIKSFAKLKAEVAGAADPLIDCLQDRALEVRREALRQAIRWAPPAGSLEEFAHVLVANLTAQDPVCRKLAGEAIAAQCPNALEHALELLEGETGTVVATVEALVRSGRPRFTEHAVAHLDAMLEVALDSADYAHRLAALRRLVGPDGEDFRFAFLRVALEDFCRHVTAMTLAGLRALHEKRGFSRVEQALRNDDPGARAEAIETLLNFGPARLAEPLARLLDAEGFEGGPARLLEEGDLEELEKHPDRWVRRAVEALQSGPREGMKDLIALKRVPLFSNLNLDQLAAIDRLMVTRHYPAGQRIFDWHDLSDELYVVVAGEVRIHRDDAETETTLARLGANSVMGEMAPFTDQPRSAGALAVSDTTVRVLRKESLEAILHEHPDVLLEVIRNLSQRLVVADEQLAAAARSAPTAAVRRRTAAAKSA